jgi:hypothetical protein
MFLLSKEEREKKKEVEKNNETDMKEDNQLFMNSEKIVVRVLPFSQCHRCRRYNVEVVGSDLCQKCNSVLSQ